MALFTTPRVFLRRRNSGPPSNIELAFTNAVITSPENRDHQTGRTFTLKKEHEVYLVGGSDKALKFVAVQKRHKAVSDGLFAPMAFHITHSNGLVENDPPLSILSSLLSELDWTGAEHGDVPSGTSQDGAYLFCATKMQSWNTRSGATRGTCKGFRGKGFWICGRNWRTVIFKVSNRKRGLGTCERLDFRLSFATQSLYARTEGN